MMIDDVKTKYNHDVLFMKVHKKGSGSQEAVDKLTFWWIFRQQNGWSVTWTNSYADGIYNGWTVTNMISFVYTCVNNAPNWGFRVKISPSLYPKVLHVLRLSAVIWLKQKEVSWVDNLHIPLSYTPIYIVFGILASMFTRILLAINAW